MTLVSEMETYLFRSVSAVLSQAVSDGNTPGDEGLPRQNNCSEDLPTAVRLSMCYCFHLLAF